uniref:Uncharacterized protein n=1 Tax=Kalanchoe fedtschenkoi TaxID=63787 RepID=A0A7N0ZRG3_KALFE
MAANQSAPEAQPYPPYSYTAVQMAIRAAIELNVFNILAKSGPVGTQLSAAQIASNIPTNNLNAATFLNRILRYLAINSYLTTSLPPGSAVEDNRLYGLTLHTANMLVNIDPLGELTTMVSSLLLLNTEMEVLAGFYRLKDAVLDPRGPVSAFEAAHGVGVYEYIAERPCSRLAVLFNQSMGRSTTLFFDNVLRAYGCVFDGAMEVLDVGGNAGAALERIISVWPDVKGVNFDLPHVISRAPFIEGVTHVAGDMFESLPDSKTILLKWVLHNWSDEQCLKLLKNCWRALPEEGGKVIVLEFVIPQDLERTDRAAVDAITLDFIMMALYGGKERTEAEFRDLAMAAGFISVSVVPVGDGIHVLELVK